MLYTIHCLTYRALDSKVVLSGYQFGGCFGSALAIGDFNGDGYVAECILFRNQFISSHFFYTECTTPYELLLGINYCSVDVSEIE